MFPLSAANLHSLAGCSLSASCCCAHLLLCDLPDLPGRGIDAKLLQRVDDLASGADGDCAVEDEIQMVDAGILSAEQEGTVSVSSERENLSASLRRLWRQSDNELQ